MGSAVPTLGYNLPAKYIIHAVVPRWIDGMHNEYDLLSTTFGTEGKIVIEGPVEIRSAYKIMLQKPLDSMN